MQLNESGKQSSIQAARLRVARRYTQSNCGRFTQREIGEAHLFDSQAVWHQGRQKHPNRAVSASGLRRFRACWANVQEGCVI